MKRDKLDDSVALQLRRATALYGPKKEGRISNPTFIQMHSDELSPQIKADAAVEEKSKHVEGRYRVIAVPTRY